MARKEYDLWLTRFQREIGIKPCVILSGNVQDVMCNPNNRNVYEPVMQSILSAIRAKGYTKIVKWDRVEGIDSTVSDALDFQEQPEVSSFAYDMGPDHFLTADMTPTNTYKSPDEFFPYLLRVIAQGREKIAFVLDYSDALFGNANALSEKEREYLATLGKALERAQPCQIMAELDTLIGVNSLVVIVAKNNATIPPMLYLDNPLACTLTVPLPGRNERERFVTANMPCLRLSQDLDSDQTLKADFVDALDGFTLRDIIQLIKLSRQVEERMSFEKLINLFRYGESVSPWEELSREKLMEVEARLQERVKGQDHAIQKVKDVLIRAYTGFSGLQHSAKQRKPKGTLFFVGPTGVGKTELAKALAEFVFGDESACIRFDMSEYNHEHSDQRLVGAPPGYVGYEAGGQLTNAVKEKPFCVLLFDEIEKAHGKILDKFLQILEDGRLTDGKGETVCFSEAIIIFTSNIGAAKVSAELQPAEVRRAFEQEVQRHFIEDLQRPELLNRIGDNIVTFGFIENQEVFQQIAKAKFQTVTDFVRERYKATIVFQDENVAFAAIARKAGRQNGGRGLLNVMEDAIVNPLSQFIFERLDFLAGRRIRISLVELDLEKNPQNVYFDFELM